MTDDERPPEQTSYDLPFSAALDVFMTQGWDETERLDGPADIAPYAGKRRSALSARFPGETLVVPSGGYRLRSNDTEYLFRPGSDFAYLTGEMEPDGVLVLTPTSGGHDAVLYRTARRRRSDGPDYYKDRTGEFWMGPRRAHREAEDHLGLECRDLADLEGVLSGLDAGRTRVRRGLDATVDAGLAGDEERDSLLAAQLAEQRLVKDDWEVAQLEDAVAATVRGFEDVVRALPRAMETSERMIEGVFYTRARVDGNNVGYNSIAAAGPHATTLHWTRNDGPVRPGDMLLLDAGVENRWLYTADVTRTLPIGGAFSDVQRWMYDLVLAAQQAGIDAVKPGAGFRDYHWAAMTVIVHGLVDAGLLRCSADEALHADSGIYRRYTLHATGHMLGIDVHDCAKARRENYTGGTLEPGMCLTVEPGLYFQGDDLTVPVEYRGQGVRIEDDVLVTPDGCRILSAALPRTSADVETWMASLS